MGSKNEGRERKSSRRERGSRSEDRERKNNGSVCKINTHPLLAPVSVAVHHQARRQTAADRVWATRTSSSCWRRTSPRKVSLRTSTSKFCRPTRLLCVSSRSGQRLPWTPEKPRPTIRLCEPSCRRWPSRRMCCRYTTRERTASSMLMVTRLLFLFFFFSGKNGRFQYDIRYPPVIHTENAQYDVCLYTLCFKNGQPFYFCDFSVCCWLILKTFGNIAAKEICNKIHISNFIWMRGI